MHEKNKEHETYINNKSNFLPLQNINNLQAQIKTIIGISKQLFLPNLAKIGKYKYKH